jgi:hypothetical protein
MGETLMKQHRVEDEGVFVVNSFSEGITLKVLQE